MVVLIFNDFRFIEWELNKPWPNPFQFSTPVYSNSTQISCLVFLWPPWPHPRLFRILIITDSVSTLHIPPFYSLLYLLDSWISTLWDEVSESTHFNLPLISMFNCLTLLTFFHTFACDLIIWINLNFFSFLPLDTEGKDWVCVPWNFMNIADAFFIFTPTFYFTMMYFIFSSPLRW